MHKPVHGGDVWPYITQRRILDFSSNVNPLGPPKEVIEALLNELWRVQYYPDPECSELRTRIAEIEAISPENVLVCNGSMEAIYLFSSVFLRGKTALVFNPTFEEYEASARAYDARVVNVFLGPKYSLTYHLVKEKLQALNGVSALFLCNPNNPTGSIIEPDILSEIAQLTCSLGVMLFIDETFIDFLSANLRLRAAELLGYPNVVIARSMTKSYCLPGLRIGYCIASREVIERLNAVKPTWSVNALAQLAAIKALESSEKYLEKSRKIIESEKLFLREAFSKGDKIVVYPSYANFLLLELKEHDSDVVKRQLLKKGILVRSCSSFKGLGPRYLRIAVRLRWENELLALSLKQALGM
ncbi:MAG: hypothetical protein DRJ31_03890 [Candidatus Methanomethylicota archaeon]|uniref:Aminotransferase class I/classII large domain-containing protein n=1 Tax=Thermoproteota archaeon TaxID=2056631 RepID=A0A497EQU1_9CREN|nr:MAG: hypothetical protein DRJ31_03890 [Candidatus Verstraetearchaeota archaeon]